VLDEPTNDLDLPTLAVLEQFLEDYPGCLLIVSHDRYFMDRLVDHLFVFEGDGVVHDFPGNYTEYRLWQKERETQSSRNAQVLSQELQHKDTATPAQERKERKKLSYREQQEFERLEREIPELEKEKQVITEQMSSEGLPFEQLQQLAERIATLTQLLEEKEMRWLELSELGG